MGISVATAAATGASGLLGSSERCVGATAEPPKSVPHAKENAIPVRRFGKTGEKLPVLGMGGSAMVARWIKSYGAELLSLDERSAMVRHAYDCGVRYFDTARVYDESETIVGLGLEGVRKNVFLATKVATVNPELVRSSLEQSLEELRTDHVDLVQIHSPVIERVGFEGAMKVHEQLLKLRDEKMLRFVGLTTHVAFGTVYKMIVTGGFDQVLLAYGYFKKGMDTLLSNENLEFRSLCLSKAHELGMAIVAMKVMGARIFGHNARNLVPAYDQGDLARLPGAAIRWVLQDQRIAVLNIGVSLPTDIDGNIEVLRGDPTFSNEDQRLLADFSRRCYENNEIRTMRTV
jgi:predicted aldo/keto reductase-like oxidoreductase